MSKNRREEIYNSLNAKETEDLLEIWQNGDTSEWEEQVFEIVKEILLERLGYVPPQSIEIQVSLILDKVEQYLENNELDQALSECELAVQMEPESAIVYNYRGIIYDEMGQLENAIINYQRAIQLDPELKDAWKNLLSIESVIEEGFEGSFSKGHLDQALEYAYNNEPEKAWEECETAKLTMPSIAIAYNYLGLILQTIHQLEPAIDSYLKAILLNPRFYVARENLAYARISWEEEQYRLFSSLSPVETQETSIDLDESQVSEIIKNGNPISGWFYLDEKAFLLTGWAGHRNRPGRSGYDPLETDFEQAHLLGVFFRWLITGKFRTRNPVYLILMTYAGLVYCLPLLAITSLFQGDWDFLLLLIVIISSPCLIFGIALLVNVFLCLLPEKTSQYDDNDHVILI